MIQPGEIVGAIDIGTTKIVTIIGMKNDAGKLDILAMAKTESKGVRRGMVQNIEDTVAAIKKTVEEAESKAGVKLTNVFVGIAGQHIRSIKNQGYINRHSIDDEITRNDIKMLENDMKKIPIDVGEEIIHVIPQHYIVDNEPYVKNPVGMSGKRVAANFHIVIAQIAAIRNIEKCIKRAGLNVICLVLEPLASALSVLTDDEKEAGVALVDIGGGTTDIAIYYDDIVRHTAVIPFGGNVITKDIKEGCAILQRQAELLKVQFGSALGDLADPDKVVSIPGIAGRDPKEISFKSLAYIIQSRMEEILDAVCFEIESSGYMDKLSAGIVVTGGGAMLKHLPQLVKFKTGMDVRIGYPVEHLASVMNSEINNPMYATAVGLVLKGFDYMGECTDKSAFGSFLTQINEVKQEVYEPAEELEMAGNEKVGVSSENHTRSSKPSFLDSVRRTFGDLFDENDTKM